MSGATAAPARISPFAVFRKRDFTLLWTAQLVSTAGSALTDLAESVGPDCLGRAADRRRCEAATRHRLRNSEDTGEVRGGRQRRVGCLSERSERVPSRRMAASPRPSRA